MNVELRDPLAAIVAMFNSTKNIKEWAGDRIFAPEIPPEDFAADKPAPRTIVIEPMPGDNEQSRLAISDRMYTIKIFAPTPKESRVAYNRIYPRLKALRTEEHAGILIYNAIPSDPMFTRDVRTDWPGVACQARIRTSEVSV